MTTTVSGAEFNQRPSQVKRAAEVEPVVITEHGRPSLVLMTYADYVRLRQVPGDLASWLEMDEDVDFGIETSGFDLEPAEL